MSCHAKAERNKLCWTLTGFIVDKFFPVCYKSFIDDLPRKCDFHSIIKLDFPFSRSSSPVSGSKNQQKIGFDLLRPVLNWFDYYNISAKCSHYHKNIFRV